MIKSMSIESSQLGFLDVQIHNNGARCAQVDFTRTEVEFNGPLPGMGIIDPKQWATCTSEIPYYMGSNKAPSRFMQDSGNTIKKQAYLPRTLGTGFTSDPNDISHLMTSTPFHEGWGLLRDFNPDENRSDIPVQLYVPQNGTGPVRLERQIMPMNFQTGFSPGSVMVLNPAILCDEHSNANNIDPNTGWPVQCHRGNHSPGNHTKATRGHTEAPGTAISGTMPVTLDSLTPLSQTLSDFIIENPKRRGIIATSVEPLACVYQAHGPLLMNGEVPESVAIIGDGPNSLLMLLFYQMYAPKANIIVVGKNQAKLDSLQKVNPDRIRTVGTDGRMGIDGYDDLSYALQEITGNSRADVVIPTVALPEETVSPFIKDNGMLIWWAASISENAVKSNNLKPYREFHSYGGAPRGEFSAALGFDWLLQNRPETLDPLMDFPGIYTTDMGHGAAKDVQTWLNDRGRFTRPDNGLSAKLVVNMM